MKPMEDHSADPNTDPADHFARAAESAEPDVNEPVDPSRLVPTWLAALVLVLLLAVMVVGGYVLRGVLTGANEPVSPVQSDILKWEQAVEATPDDPEAHLSLGFAYQQDKRYEDALTHYDIVESLRPRDTAALYNSGVVLLELGRDEEAEAKLWDVLEIEPEHILAAKVLGEYYAERREYRSLIVAVRPAAEANESAADLQYLMGLAYENIDHLDWAETRYRLALKYYPDMPEALEGLDRLEATP